MIVWNSCFSYDPTDVDNLISGSSAFSKTSLNNWKFTVHILLKPGFKFWALEQILSIWANFEHLSKFWEFWALLCLHVRWVQLCSNLSILWLCLSLGLKWKHLFQSCAHWRVFQIFWHIECSTFTASSFRIWNSSTGIPSPPLCS